MLSKMSYFLLGRGLFSRGELLVSGRVTRIGGLYVDVFPFPFGAFCQLPAVHFRGCMRLEKTKSGEWKVVTCCPSR